MREAGARGRYFITHCSRCLLASPPLPAPRVTAERRARTLGWMESEGSAGAWLCPRCVVRGMNGFFDDPTLRALTSGGPGTELAQRYVVRITCERCPVILPDGPKGAASFDAWVAAVARAPHTAVALKRTLAVTLVPAPRLPSGVSRAAPRPSSIEFDRFDEETLALDRVRWEVDVEGTMRPDARTLRWLRTRLTLASAIEDGSVAFDLALAEAWLVTS